MSLLDDLKQQGKKDHREISLGNNVLEPNLDSRDPHAFHTKKGDGPSGIVTAFLRKENPLSVKDKT